MSPICKETFNVNKESENVIIHKIDTKFPCNVCNKQFKRKIALDTHLKTHKSLKQNDKFSCDICHKKFKHERYLMKHKRHCHSLRSEDFYPSDICIDEFKDSATEAIRCEVCSELFTCQRYLEKHKLLQTELPDEMCFRKYYCITNFTTIKKNNNGNMVKLYSCDLCHKQADRVRNFRRHMASHFRKEKIIFSCDLCGKKFDRRFNFMRHMTLRHYSSKPRNVKTDYNCAVCCRKFNRRANLRRHMTLIHYSNKPRKLVYNCAVCCKQFYSNFNFKRHMTLIHNKPRKLKMKEVSVDLERLQIKGLDLVNLQSNTHSDHETLNIEQNNPTSAANQHNKASPHKHLSEESRFAVHVYASEILDMDFDIVKQEQDDLVDDNNIQENLDHFVSVFHQQTNLTATEDTAKDKVEKAIIEANSNLEKTLLKESMEVDKAVENDGFVADTEHNSNPISDLKEMYSRQNTIQEIVEKSQRKSKAVSQQNKNEQSLSWRRDLKGNIFLYL